MRSTIAIATLQGELLITTKNSSAKISGPTPWANVSEKDLTGIKGVCLDIDETLSTKGKLTAEAFGALWDLNKAGFAVIPVTGRPAGWCDHIARFWPVHALVGENGAFSFFMHKGVRRRLDTPGNPLDAKSRLVALSERIIELFPHAKWASDQRFREFDLAIDVNEDVERWPDKDVQELLRLCEQEGAHAKLSSVHVNAWFGNYDKLSGLENWLNAGSPGWNGEALKLQDLLYIGDSPNDEPMFAKFAKSVGVANIQEFIEQIQHKPRWVTQSQSGAGFAEMAAKLISKSGITK